MTKWICPNCKGIIDDELEEIPKHLEKEKELEKQ